MSVCFDLNMVFLSIPTSEQVVYFVCLVRFNLKSLFFQLKAHEFYSNLFYLSALF